MTPKQKDRIDHIFKFMEYEYLTDGEENLIISFNEQWDRREYLSERQIEILEDIFKRAAERA